MGRPPGTSVRLVGMPQGLRAHAQQPRRTLPPWHNLTQTHVPNCTRVQGPLIGKAVAAVLPTPESESRCTTTRFPAMATSYTGGQLFVYHATVRAQGVRSPSCVPAGRRVLVPRTRAASQSTRVGRWHAARMRARPQRLHP